MIATAVFSGNDLAAEIVILANRPHPIEAGRAEDYVSPATPTDVAGGVRDDAQEVPVSPSAPSHAAAASGTVSAPASGSEAHDGLRSIRQLSVNIRPPSGDLPGEPAAARFAAAGDVYQVVGTNRPWPQYCYWWEAPGVCHRPLYFEQVNLERYGYSCGVAQPLVSAAHFFGTIPALPYLMVAQPCGQCVYTLGHDRPGSCAPFHLYYPPLSLRGAAAEAGVVTGLIFAIP